MKEASKNDHISLYEMYGIGTSTETERDLVVARRRVSDKCLGLGLGRGGENGLELVVISEMSQNYNLTKDEIYDM